MSEELYLEVGEVRKEEDGSPKFSERESQNRAEIEQIQKIISSIISGSKSKN